MGAAELGHGNAGGIPDNVLEVAEMQTIIGLVASGLGVSLVPASVSETERPGVAFRPLADPSPAIELALAWATDARSPVREAFLELAAPIGPRPGLKSCKPPGAFRYFSRGAARRRGRHSLGPTR